jgi:hypothetical protein
MRRLLSLLLLCLAACSSVQTAQIDVPQPSHDVQGANPRRWNQPLSFGPWHTTAVHEGATRSWLADLGVLQVAQTDQALHFALKGSSGITNVECHTRELTAGRAGIFVQASLGNEPVLVCGLERDQLRSVLALTRTGKIEPALRGELRQLGGTTYDVRSLQRASRSSIVSSEPFGFEIDRDETAFAVIETVNRGRVWINPEAPNKDDLAAAAAVLLLWRDAGAD